MSLDPNSFDPFGNHEDLLWVLAILFLFAAMLWVVSQ